MNLCSAWALESGLTWNPALVTALLDAPWRLLDLSSVKRKDSCFGGGGRAPPRLSAAGTGGFHLSSVERAGTAPSGLGEVAPPRLSTARTGGFRLSSVERAGTAALGVGDGTPTPVRRRDWRVPPSGGGCGGGVIMSLLKCLLGRQGQPCEANHAMPLSCLNNVS